MRKILSMGMPTSAFLRNGISLALLINILVACDKTENEDAVKRLFIEAAPPSAPETNNYNNVVSASIVYLQEFKDAATSDWEEKSDEYATYTITDGNLSIKAKKDFYVWDKFNINSSMDFQIETGMAFNSPVKSKHHGLVFGINNPSYYYFTIIGGTDNSLNIGYYNGNKSALWYDKPSVFSPSSYHVYTIRKFGTKMSFFMDETFCYMTDYNDFTANYGFQIPKGATLLVDYIRIDYIITK
ncbi:MAG: hypothetical protein LBG80_02310 [Bacteroidales bacterium]|nr:hypothetical protein [Bacteroidales bacterium]